MVVLDDLTTRQHVRPHQPLGEALADASAETGLCPGAASQSLEWLQIDPATGSATARRERLDTEPVLQPGA